jgi:hypothetical protein
MLGADGQKPVRSPCKFVANKKLKKPIRKNIGTLIIN